MTAAAKKSVLRRAEVKPTSDRSIRIERIFDASRDRVWAAMTEPELLAQWWGRGNKLTVERFELERGGHWRFVEHVGKQRFGFEGRFREVKKPELLEQTFEWDGAPGHVTVNRSTLHALPDGRTKLVTESLWMTAEDFAWMTKTGMEDGMNASYRALDALLARMPEKPVRKRAAPVRASAR